MMACFFCARTGERVCSGPCGLGCGDCPGEIPPEQAIYNERYGYQSEGDDGRD